MQFADDAIEQDLAELAAIARELLDAPLAIWLTDPSALNLELRGYVGFDVGTWQTVAGLVALQVRAGAISLEPKAATLVDAVPTSPHPCAMAIRSHNSDRGVVIALFSRQVSDDDDRRAGAVARLFSRWIERTEQLDLQRRLARIARETTAVPDTLGSMQLIVDQAREMTGASAAMLCLVGKTGPEARACSPPDTDASWPPGRSDDPLLRQVLETGSSVQLPDTRGDDRTRAEFQRGVRSLIAVPVWLGDERMGALFVWADRTERFGSHHEAKLTALAGCASAALGWWRLLIQSANDLDAATLDMIAFDRTAETLCEDVRSEFGFEFVALQLTRENERLIETVASIGLAERSMSVFAKHGLDVKVDVRDIHADVYHTRNVEVIHGDDPRFDRWIFKTYLHGSFSRGFLPLVIARDERGELVENWWDSVDLSQREGFGSENYRIKPSYPDLQFTVVGTLEVGFMRPTEIAPSTMTELAKMLAGRTPSLWKAQLPYVLESALERATRLIRADSATLHLIHDVKLNRFRYEAAARTQLAQRLVSFPPRPGPGGLGQRAIASGQPMFSKFAELKVQNPRLCDEGVRSLGAFPATIGDRGGVLYLHFTTEHSFTPNEVGWVALLVRSITRALHHLTAYAGLREQAARFEALPRILSALTSVTKADDQLERLVHDTLYLLGADVVTLYEYLDSSCQFLTPPTLAGRLIRHAEMRMTIRKGDVPELLIREVKNVYAEDAQANRLLCGPRQGEAFVFRENIEACAAVVLRTATETVGVMFVNYRRPHSFMPGEKQLIETLATAAATAILGRRAAINAGDMAALGNHVGSLTHELRDRLGLINAHLEQFVSVNPGLPTAQLEPMRRALDGAVTSAEQILNLREESLDRVNLKDVIDGALNRPDLPSTIQSSIDIPSLLPDVRGGQRSMGAMFRELVSNAVKHGIPEGGTLRVAARPAHRQWLRNRPRKLAKSVRKGVHYTPLREGRVRLVVGAGVTAALGWRRLD